MKKLAPLLALYFSQGLPFGFQASALPLLLRERGVSLQAIGFAGLLSAPWLLKAFWAPLVDRYGSATFGRRKSWIVPTQVLLALCALAAARADNSTALFALIFAMNLCAATQDIAVDGLAVSWLEPHELGPGNALQVVGYKLGMLTGGGLLVWASGTLGWSGVFDAIALLMVAVLVVSIRMREPQPSPRDEGTGSVPPVPTFAELLARLRVAWQQPAAPALIAVVLTYKMGESLADAMWKPMLFDRGFASADIGLWSGTFGMLFSLAGSTAMGALVRHWRLSAALMWIAVLRAVGVAAQWWLSGLLAPTSEAVIVVTCIEHLFGGAITTVMFALMMRHADPRIGATHYTVLASLEVWGKLPFGALSGVIAASLGYSSLYAIASALCVGFALLAAAMRQRLAS